MTAVQKIELIGLIQADSRVKEDGKIFTTTLADYIGQVKFHKTRYKSYNSKYRGKVRGAVSFNLTPEELEVVDDYIAFMEYKGAITKFNDNLHIVSEDVLSYRRKEKCPC